MRATTRLRVLGVIGAVAAVAGCGSTVAFVRVPGGHAGDAPKLIQAFGCGACHAIAGVEGANGRIGPSLTHFAQRRYIAGSLPNTPQNVVRWIRHPQEIEPGTVMPDLGVAESQARDIAAYLYRH